MPMPDPAGPETGVEQARQSELPLIVDVLARAFQDDPVIGWLLPDPLTRPTRLRRFFAIEVRHFVVPQGCVWTTLERTGAALIVAPGRWRAPLRSTLLEGGAFWARLARASRLGVAMEWHHGRLAHGRHYYVRDVGVVPEAQGQGLGTALLAPTLAACDREHLPAYLEASSERSAVLYERLGFRQLRELRVGSSPPLLLMRRGPAGTGG
jgi:GNAT superfamily N-acetyltransferase